MKLDPKRQMSDSFRIAALLAVIGGFLDAYTYVARGGVFANAQTGNIVLLGLHIAEKKLDERPRLFCSHPRLCGRGISG